MTCIQVRDSDVNNSASDTGKYITFVIISGSVRQNAISVGGNYCCLITPVNFTLTKIPTCRGGNEKVRNEIHLILFPIVYNYLMEKKITLYELI